MDLAQTAAELERAFLLEYDRADEALRERGAAKDRLTEADAAVSEREAVRRAADQALGLAAQDEAIVRGSCASAWRERGTRQDQSSGDVSD